MNLNPQYQRHNDDDNLFLDFGCGVAAVATLVLVLILLFAFTGCVTDSAGNSHFDAKTALEAVKTGEAIYEDYDRAQHPERFPTYP